MNDNPVNCIRSLHPKSAMFLLWKVFLRDSQRGLKYWLAAGFEIGKMPLAMLFGGNDTGLVAKHFVTEQMKYEHGNLMFLPELLETGYAADDRLSEICSDEFMHALRIIRSRHVLKEDEIQDSDEMGKQALSMQIRTQGAILSDDKGWLGAIAAEPGFAFATSQLAFAARHGSIECFRFLSINGAEYSQAVIEAAVYGGNEEVIQMCMEHGCEIGSREVMRESVRGCQSEVVEWLMDVHGMKVTAADIATAVMNGNYDFVVRFEPVLFEAQSIDFEKFDTANVPRNNDFRIFIERLLDSPLKEHVIRDARLVLYCDDVELAKRCETEIGNFHSIVFAAKHDCQSLLMEISQQGNIDTLDMNGNTAFVQCASQRSLNEIVILLKYGANIERANKYGQTALINAAENGCTDTVKYLVEHGANLEAVDKYGFTALMHAADYGDTDTVEYLVEHGANMEVADEHGWTALMRAAKNEYADTVRYLVDHGANVNAMNYSRQTALMFAARKGHTDIIHCLVEHGANMEVVDDDGRTVFMRSADDGDTDTVEYLVEHGANVEAVDEHGWTTLMRTASNGKTDIVEYIVEHGASVDAAHSNGQTALMCAARNGHKDIVKCLVEHGANVDAVDSDGRTALMRAADNGKTDIVEYLVEHGASVDSSNKRV